MLRGDGLEICRLSPHGLAISGGGLLSILLGWEVAGRCVLGSPRRPAASAFRGCGVENNNSHNPNTAKGAPSPPPGGTKLWRLGRKTEKEKRGAGWSPLEPALTVGITCRDSDQLRSRNTASGRR